MLKQFLMQYNTKFMQHETAQYSQLSGQPCWRCWFTQWIIDTMIQYWCNIDAVLMQYWCSTCNWCNTRSTINSILNRVNSQDDPLENVAVSGARDRCSCQVRTLLLNNEEIINFMKILILNLLFIIVHIHMWMYMRWRKHFIYVYMCVCLWVTYKKIQMKYIYNIHICTISYPARQSAATTRAHWEKPPPPTSGLNLKTGKIWRKLLWWEMGNIKQKMVNMKQKMGNIKQKMWNIIQKMWNMKQKLWNKKHKMETWNR